MDPQDYLKQTLDPLRLAILGAAAVGDVDVDAIAASFDVDRRQVLRQIAKLTEGELLDQDRRLRVEALRSIAASLPDLEPTSDEHEDGTWSPEERKVLRSFFEGSRLKQIPAQRSKRLIVLERLAQEFDPGVRYPEKQVSFMLQLIHPDYAAVRRYLVDEEFPHSGRWRLLAFGRSIPGGRIGFVVCR